MALITFDLTLVTSVVDFTVSNNNGDATITDPANPGAPAASFWELDNIVATTTIQLNLDQAIYDINLNVVTTGSVDLGVSGVFVSIAPPLATISSTKVVDYTLTV